MTSFLGARMDGLDVARAASLPPAVAATNAQVCLIFA